MHDPCTPARSVPHDSRLPKPRRRRLRSMQRGLRTNPIPASGPSFDSVLSASGRWPLTRSSLQELQINLGKLCNQACAHCHVDAGPKRTEIMNWDTMTRIMDWFATSGLQRADITGGAPELNPHFRRLVDGLMALGAGITVRCNLTVLFESGQEDLAAWYADRGVRIVCSLPCYSRTNVDEQRGRGVFNKSIEALRRLNRHGYGGDEGLILDLVYNPAGAFLPPHQEQLERDYKRRLGDGFGIRFNRLLTLANLPINRFAHYLDRNEQLESYQQLLVDNFNSDTVTNLMCRSLLSVDWRGHVFDCDFNQMLEIPHGDCGPLYLWDVDAQNVASTPIAVDRHCFGCTAGCGSSCGGALT